MAERHSFWPPGLRAVAARRSKALSSSAPPCQISPHAPTSPGSACRNDAGMGVVSTPAAPLRTLRVAAAYLVRGVARGGCERVEERGARGAWKSRLYSITGIKKTQNGTRAARTRARITSTLTQQIKDAGSRSGEGFFDQKRDVRESGHSSWPPGEFTITYQSSPSRVSKSLRLHNLRKPSTIFESARDSGHFHM